MAGGNIVRGNGAVDAAAAAAARAASLQRNPDTAQQAGHGRGPPPRSPTEAWTAPDIQIDVDTSQFADRTPGASVRATVQCTLPLAKYAHPRVARLHRPSRTSASPRSTCSGSGPHRDHQMEGIAGSTRTGAPR